MAQAEDESGHRDVAAFLDGLRTELGDRPTVDALERMYEELRRMAHGYMARERKDHTLQPTALVHEAYLRLAERMGGATERGELLGVAAAAMRHILVDHARAQRAAKRGAGARRYTLSRLDPTPGRPEYDLVELSEALELLSTLSPRQARIVDLRFFAGLGMEEIARVLGVSLSTVEAEWRVGRAWLSARLHS